MKSEEFARHVSLEFELFQTSITNIYLTRFGIGSNVAQQSEHALKVALSEVVYRFSERLSTLTSNYLNALEVGNTDLHKVRANLFSLRMRKIMVENVRSVLQKAFSTNRSNVFTRSLGALGLILQANSQKVEFVSQDAGGKQWSSLTLVYQYARDFAYQSLIDSQAAAINGLAKVAFPDPNHKNNGLIVDTRHGDSHGLLPYEVRQLVFYPNSNAQLVPYVST